MYKKICRKKKFISIILIVIFSLFTNFKVIAVTDDDGPEVTDSNIIWHTTCYTGGKLGATNPATRTTI